MSQKSINQSYPCICVMLHIFILSQTFEIAGLSP